MAGALLAACCRPVAPAEGQAVYRWTDSKGVVHFSDSAPPKGIRFRKESLPPAAPARVSRKAAPKSAPSKPAAEPPEETKGPANVVIEEKQVEADGRSAREFSGTVKNTGGTLAREVYVAIRVHDTDQGDECIRDEIDVRPSELPPGETGIFTAWYDNPCFLGNAGVELTPEWSVED